MIGDVKIKPVLLGILVCCLLPYHMACASPYKVLVVMSYDRAYAWEQEIREGIVDGLGDGCRAEWVYLDTKSHIEGGAQMAKKAYEVFLAFKPNGVIAADDNAQSMFVVPYLKDKVDTPVIFCGVNAAPEKYGYPAGNVTGIMEKLHIRQSIAFAQQLIPGIREIAYLFKSTPSADAVYDQFKQEHDTYPVSSVAFKRLRTYEETMAALEALKGKTDALFMESFEGIRDSTGRIYNDREMIPLIAAAYGKPLISNNLYHVQYGTLCAVIKTGQEQGEIAAKMLRRAMAGTPVSAIPMVQNRKGKKVINLKIMKSMGLKPASELLMGAILVGTGDDK